MQSALRQRDNVIQHRRSFVCRPALCLNGLAAANVANPTIALKNRKCVNLLNKRSGLAGAPVVVVYRALRLCIRVPPKGLCVAPTGAVGVGEIGQLLRPTGKSLLAISAD
jgi:hypothetical protein